MNIVHAVILSVIEGITEFLPISSTGHMILAAGLLKITETDFVKSFEIIIQLGAILAVIFLYFRRLIRDTILWKKIIIAFIPAAVIGLGFYKVIKQLLLGNTIVVLISLLLGGIVLILADKYLKTKNLTINRLSVVQSLFIGLFQAVSVIPGVSRSAATIVGGLMVGLSRSEAVEFSFLLAIPTMAAATGLDLIKSSHTFSAGEFMLLAVGFTGAFLTALITVKYFVAFIKTHNFTGFGIYRILLAILYWILVIHT